MELKYSTNEEILKSIKTAREAHRSGITRNVNFRINQLKALMKMLFDNEELIAKCLLSDLSKPRYESFCAEIEVVRSIAVRAIQNLKVWVKEDHKRKPGIHLLDTIYTVPQPYGVVLIISPWNYPVYLTLMPLIGAIAAGNCAILKPSEMSESVAGFFREMIPRYLNKECFHVVSGGVEETTVLLNEKMDYIYFTGSRNVGRIVYESAAKHLTPVTLECGGKCPVFIDNDAKNIELVVRRIIWAKCMNSGQTCVAPDYVLCSSEVQDKFVSTVKQVLKEFYPNYKEYGRIINENHFRRIERLLNESDGRIAIGGKMDIETKFIEPTVVVDVTLNDALMREEIFGPVLPIIVIKDCDEAIELLRSMSEPLCTYLFTDNKHTLNKFNEGTRSGSLVCNEAILQVLVESLPFGGVGDSGFGRCNGKYSFDTFSFEKSVMVCSTNSFIDAMLSLRYPPQNETRIQLARSFSKNYNSNFPLDFTLIPQALIFSVTLFVNALKKILRL